MIETKLNGKTPDIAEENIAKLKEIFPDVFCEDKIDFEKLKQVLGNYIEAEKERYDFSWNGKERSRQLAQSPSTGTLRPCKEESKDWETTKNLYIEGDNLEVLKLLQKSYHNKIKMIYIDPPYNTGNDFVYPDDYRDNMKNYLEITGQIDGFGKKISTNPDTNGRYHTDWLNMMYPRLRLARNLLSDDGVIFISIDDNEITNLCKMCNEIFGEENFVTNLIWQKKTGASDAKGIATITEDIVIYCKNNKMFSEIFTKNTESYDLNRYRYKDEFVNERGPYYIDNLDRGGLSYSDTLNYGIECPDGTITYPNGRTSYVNDGWIWKWSKSKIDWAKKNHFIEFRQTDKKPSGWSVCYKNYLKVDNENNPIERAAPHKNLITDVLNANAAAIMKELFGTNNYFEYSKPVELLTKIIGFVQTKDSIILDFFSGSATTAHAVMQLNAQDGGKRKFICVQLPEPTDEKSEAYKAGYKNICQIGKERIRRAGEKINSEIIESLNNITHDEEKKELVDIGFKVLKLDTSNIKRWNPDFENFEQTAWENIDNIVDGRSELDLVYEIMLKYGLDLTHPVKELSCLDKNIYSIGFGMLVICVAENVSIDVVKFISDYKKKNDIKQMRVVFLDRSFDNNDSLKINTKEILKAAGVEEFITI